MYHIPFLWEGDIDESKWEKIEKGRRHVWGLWFVPESYLMKAEKLWISNVTMQNRLKVFGIRWMSLAFYFVVYQSDLLARQQLHKTFRVPQQTSPHVSCDIVKISPCAFNLCLGRYFFWISFPLVCVWHWVSIAEQNVSRNENGLHFFSSLSPPLSLYSIITPPNVYPTSYVLTICVPPPLPWLQTCL